MEHWKWWGNTLVIAILRTDTYAKTEVKPYIFIGIDSSSFLTPGRFSEEQNKYFPLRLNLIHQVELPRKCSWACIGAHQSMYFKPELNKIAMDGY